MIYHIGAHSTDNAGDSVILDSMTRLFEQVDPEIVRVHDWKPDERWEEYNQSRGVVVGGGGLFIRDTHRNENSGWRWNITTQSLNNINVPLVLYAVGYNRFRGQPDYSPVFREHIKVVLEKAAFFSMREKGSIDLMRHYVGDLADKIIYQPCPASVCGLIYPNTHTKQDSNILVFAPAMDRLQMRGNVRAIVPALKQAVKEGWCLKIATHCLSDRDFLRYLRDVKCEEVILRKKPASEILDFYSQAGCVVGMRLHSLLIPFGLGVPIVPVISHDKITNWLKDIGHEHWGVELQEKGIVEKLLPRIRSGIVDLAARDRLYKITLDNMEKIRGILNG